MGKRVAVLGSTGSIGTQTLQVIDHLGKDYEVATLAVHSNITLLEEQVQKYQPRMVAIYDEKAAEEFIRKMPHVEVVVGDEGLCRAACHADVDFVMLGMVGSKGIIPAAAAIKERKTLGLANKEILVAAGEWIMPLARQYGVEVLPVDSEHSAIFQCLQGETKETIEKLILTASGGPFLHHTEEQLAKVTFADALCHPTWTMGNKVSVDCSNLMNKGFEVMEARWLFDIAPENIEVVIHPQSLVHSMVQFCDGSIKAQISKPTMQLPIQYALTYPRRVPHDLQQGSLFSDFPKWEFYSPKKFPCLKLCYEALAAGGTYGAFLHAANEVLVERFSRNELHWLQIGEKLSSVLRQYNGHSLKTIEDVFMAEDEGRDRALNA